MQQSRIDRERKKGDAYKGVARRLDMKRKKSFAYKGVERILEQQHQSLAVHLLPAEENTDK